MKKINKKLRKEYNGIYNSEGMCDHVNYTRDTYLNIYYTVNM